MPLSSLGNINALGQAGINIAGGPTPLDAIEHRRAQRTAEATAKQVADAKLLASIENSRSGQATRANEANTMQILQSAPKITAGKDEPAKFTQEYREVMRYLMNSGDPGAIKVAKEMWAEAQNVVKTGGKENFTQMGADAESTIMGREASAGEARETARYKGAQADVLESFGSMKGATPNVTNSDIMSATDYLDDKPRQNWYSGDKGADAAQLASVAKMFETQARIAAQYGYTPLNAQEDAFKHLTSGGTYLPAFMTGAPTIPAGSRNRNAAPTNTGGQGVIDDPDGLFK